MPRRSFVVVLLPILMGLVVGCSSGKKAVVLELEQAKWAQLSGAWHVEQDGLRSTGGVIQGLDTLEDGVVQMDVELQSGPPETWATVGFRYDAPEGNVSKYNGYRLSFNWAGSYRLERGAAGAIAEVSTTPGELQGFGPKMIHVMVVLSGDTVSLSVDSGPHVTFTDATPHKGAISMSVDTAGSLVAFRQIKIDKR